MNVAFLEGDDAMWGESKLSPAVTHQEIGLLLAKRRQSGDFAAGEPGGSAWFFDYTRLPDGSCPSQRLAPDSSAKIDNQHSMFTQRIFTLKN
jgi:hypothetical protein